MVYEKKRVANFDDIVRKTKFKVVLVITIKYGKNV